MAHTIKTTINYCRDEKVRPYSYTYHRSDEEKNATSTHNSDEYMNMVEMEVLIKDARSLKMSFGVDGFELFQNTTSLTTDDFYTNPDNIIGTYYREMEEMIQKQTGAANVEIFNYTLRHAKSNQSSSVIDKINHGYAHGAHADYTAQSAEDVFKRIAAKDFEKGRFMLINAWRNISATPVGDNHLAIVHGSSITKPDDFISVDVFSKGDESTVKTQHVQSHQLWARHADRHQWYYFSKMQKNEVLLFKQWDSDSTASVRTCFHSAFKDPHAENTTPPRESIEVRAIVFFPNHTPNTCPPLEEEHDESETVAELVKEDDQAISRGIAKIMRAIEALDKWPLAGKMFVKARYYRGEPGAKAIAELLVRDPTGQLGLKNLPRGVKQTIVTAIMKRKEYFECLRVNVGNIGRSSPSADIALALLRSSTLALPKVLLVLLGCLLGWVLCKLSDQSIELQEL